MASRSVSRPEATLFLHSELSDREYPELKKYLSDNVSRVRGYENMPPAIRGYFPRRFTEIFVTCKTEWEYDHQGEIITVTDDSENRDCQLCGNERCLDLYPIKNRITEETLYVGSVCATKYKVDGHTDIASIARRRKLLKRHEELESIFPGIVDSFIDQRQAAAKNTVYIIPTEMETENITIFSDIRKAAEQYHTAASGQRDGIVSSIQALMHKYHTSSKLIDVYQETHLNNWLYPKRSYLTNIRNTSVLSRIRQECMIGENTLKFINNAEFSETHMITRLNTVLKNTGLIINGAASQSSGIGYYADVGAFRVVVDHFGICRLFPKEIINSDTLGSSSTKAVLSVSRFMERQISLAFDKLLYLFSRCNINPLSYSSTLDIINVNYRGSFVHIPYLETLQDMIYEILFLKTLSEVPQTLHNTLVKSSNQYASYNEYQDYLEIADTAGNKLTIFD